ncbi:5866_t:CDS:1, partial [Gigaspora margarita]
AILSQTDEQGREKVISYASRTLTAAEKNYSVTEQECLAIIWAVTYFWQYLHGVRFTLVIDHSALKFLINWKLPRRRIAHWILALQEYNFEIKH